MREGDDISNRRMKRISKEVFGAERKMRGGEQENKGRKEGSCPPAWFFPKRSFLYRQAPANRSFYQPQNIYKDEVQLPSN